MALPHTNVFLPSLDWMGARMKVSSRICSLLLAGLLAVTGTLVPSCSAAKPSSAKALEEFASLFRSSPSKIDELVLAGKKIENVPNSQWTSEQQELRRRLFHAYNVNLAGVVMSEVDAAVVVARAQARDSAAVTVLANASPENKPDFLDDLVQATLEVVEEQACAMMLDMMAPAEKPTDSGKAADRRDEVFVAVTKKLSARWQPESLVQAVAWVEYAVGVEKDAKRFADALSANPTAYTFLGKPPMTQITAAYLRACYSTPKLILP